MAVVMVTRPVVWQRLASCLRSTSFDIFVSSTDNLNIITLDHLKMNIASVGNTEHFDSEIDLAGSEGIVVSVMVTTAPTSTPTIAPTMISTTAPVMAPACAGVANCTHAPTCRPHLRIQVVVRVDS